MAIHRDTYSEIKVQNIRKMVEQHYKNDWQQDYSIAVDDLQVIPRTDELERFDDFEQYITPETHSITFCLFKGDSNNCDRHVLILKERTSELSGMLQEQADRVSAYKVKELEYAHLLERYDWMRKKFTRKKKKVKALRAELEEIRQNPVQVLSKAVGKGMDYWDSRQQRTLPEESLGEPEVTVSKVDENDPLERLANAIRSLQGEQLDIVIEINRAMAMDPLLIEELKNYLIQKSKNDE